MATSVLLLSALAVLGLGGLSEAGLSKRAPVVPSTLPGDYEYYGCWTDVGRTISSASYSDNTGMTDEACINYCSALGWQYAGTEYYQECYCGSALAATAEQVDDSECSYACTGNSSEVCGGSSLLTIFYSPATVGPQPNPGVAGWDYVGCYSEGTTGRTLTYGVGSIDSADMTVALCTAACKAAGYILAGVEYGGECYCGNTISNGGLPATSGCDTVCNGNSSEYCGGGDRLNLYDYLDEYSFTTSTTTGTGSTSTTAVSSATASASATTTSAAGSATTSMSLTVSSTVSIATPSVTGLPDGWTYRGCWVDAAYGRIMTDQLDDNNALTNELCVQECVAAGYTVAGTEYGVQCFCGNFTQNGAALVDDSECSSACPGNTAEDCGAGARMSLWATGDLTQYAVPSVQNTSLPGDWTYSGCVSDNTNDVKTFPWEVLLWEDDLTPELCLNRCAEYGYMAAAIEYGYECFCGDPENIVTAGATYLDESSCNIICPGLPSALCGGGNALTTYFWTGTPFYTWTFPQDPAEAGEYTFLIGGVTVPLMTMQSITGKVSFLSKGPGTSLGNETGAYELDLTATDNFTLAWRTLHVKTDVFCSAGFTLPDRVGRQLTVGGWAGSSTQGTRLYWPDGSDGVWGTNDWEENVSELSLKAERWYPSILVLTNGSILIVGGEECSNCAATPSIEILPDTGTEPLYMQWLADTDPNNLYPFLAILPSGGIFVGYWNEARIIDPDTFDTIRTLPNMPGTVSDDTSGGRTYPQEGSMVLLPQYAPYTDPLGVLICGGSTVGAGYALDTCISMEPDVVGANWTIERMPSFRVIPCMAPLPDGTYMIMNGAVHGWAGFGLATEGNLNALLYDPTKAVGSRITVMANTTIARLYHNEAITLLDGRVLVSGSDPTGGVTVGTEIEEYRVEVFSPPYLLSGKTRPTFTLDNIDWSYGETGIEFALGSAPVNGAITVSLLGAVSSTHGNAMGARTLFPAVAGSGTSYTVEAPPSANIAPPGWYQFFVLDGGIPAVGVFIRIGGDPAELGNWPPYDDFTVPGMGAAVKP